jgi:biopolymer transport protein TolR
LAPAPRAGGKAVGTVTIGKLRAKIRKLHEEHEEEEMENGELNLVPYLDIVTNVIMFLMMTTTFAAAMASINVSSPSIGARGAQDQADSQTKQDLNLTVSISDKGFIVAASGAVLFENDVPGKLPTLPNKAGDYDYLGLTQKMKLIKDNFQDETKVIINANPEIRYEIVVNAMDAIRQEGPRLLFPDVVLAAGVN